MLVAEKIVEGGFSGKEPWRGVFALAVQASGWTFAGNAGSAGRTRAAVSSASRGPTRRPIAPAWSRSPGGHGQGILLPTGTSLGGHSFCQKL